MLCILCLLWKSAKSNNFTIWCVFITGCLSILSGINMLVVLKEEFKPRLQRARYQFCYLNVLEVFTWYQISIKRIRSLFFHIILSRFFLFLVKIFAMKWTPKIILPFIEKYWRFFTQKNNRLFDIIFRKNTYFSKSKHQRSFLSFFLPYSSIKIP